VLRLSVRPHRSDFTTSSQLAHVSVIVPFRNAAAWLPATLASLAEQRGVAYELVAVDDASSDGSAEVLRRCWHQLGSPAPLRLLAAGAPGGVSMARNRGWRAARAELVAFLDADDLCLGQRLALQSQRLLREPGLGQVLCGWRRLPQAAAAGAAAAEGCEVRPWQEGAGFDPEAAFRFKAVLPSAWMLRRSALELVGGFDPGLGHAEDVDLLLRLALAGVRGAWVEQVLCGYRVHGGGASRRLRPQTQGLLWVLSRALQALPMGHPLRQQQRELLLGARSWSAWKAWSEGEGDLALELWRSAWGASPLGPARTWLHLAQAVESGATREGHPWRGSELLADPVWRRLEAHVLAGLQRPQRDQAPIGGPADHGMGWGLLAHGYHRAGLELWQQQLAAELQALAAAAAEAPWSPMRLQREWCPPLQPTSAAAQNPQPQEPPPAATAATATDTAATETTAIDTTVTDTAVIDTAVIDTAAVTTAAAETVAMATAATATAAIESEAIEPGEAALWAVRRQALAWCEALLAWRGGAEPQQRLLEDLAALLTAWARLCWHQHGDAASPRLEQAFALRSDPALLRALARLYRAAAGSGAAALEQLADRLASPGDGEAEPVSVVGAAALADLPQPLAVGGSCRGPSCSDCGLASVAAWERRSLAEGCELWIPPFTDPLAGPEPELGPERLPGGRAWLRPPLASPWGMSAAVTVADRQGQRQPHLCRRYPHPWPACPLTAAMPQEAEPPGPPLELEGSVLAVADLSAEVHYHWLLEQLPRLGRALAALTDQERRQVRVWHNGGEDPRRLQMLQQGLGLAPERLIDARRQPHIRAEQLLVPPFSGRFGWPPPGAQRWLRRQLLPREAHRAAAPPGRRLWLSRGRSSRRPVWGEAALLERLAAEGLALEPVDLGAMPLPKQARLVQEATLVVAPHGGAMAALVFAQPGTRVLELHQPRYAPPYFHAIVQERNLRYARCEQPAEAPALYRELVFEGPLLEPIQLDPSRCIAALRALTTSP